MKKIVLVLIIIIAGVFSVHGQDFDFGSFPSMGGSLGNPTLEKGRNRADDAKNRSFYPIPMRFFNALDGRPIPQAAVEIPGVGTLVTNNAGKIVFERIPDGNYTLVFSRDGFITTSIDFRVLLGAVDFNWYSISPRMPERGRDYRIVLTWNERPADLDLHFVKTNDYHISFFNMRVADDGHAVLDRDDTSGHGPETITIGRIDSNASYVCYVHDYTNRNNTNSTQMAREGAVIRVYSQNRLIHTFTIPSNGTGTRWNVFIIENGNIIPVNTVTAR